MAGNIKLFLSTQKWDFESAFIRRGTNCAWSHAGWYDTDTKMTFSAMSDGKGLAWRPVKPKQEMLILDAPGAAEALALALKHEGTPYDILDIVGLIIGKNWTTPGRLICDVAVFRFSGRGWIPVGQSKIHSTDSLDATRYPAQF